MSLFRKIFETVENLKIELILMIKISINIKTIKIPEMVSFFIAKIYR